MTDVATALSDTIRTGAILRRSDLTGSVYVVTRWKELPNGAIEALKKFDVTADFLALASPAAGPQETE